MISHISAEQQCLALLARAELTAEERRRIRGILARPFGWDAMAQSAEDHGVVPTVVRNLKRLGWVGVPEATQRSLETSERLNAAREHVVSRRLSARRAPDGLHPGSGRSERTADAGDLIDGLNRACALERRLSIHQAQARLCERSYGTGVHPLDADGRRRATMPANLVANLAGPGPLGIGDPIACRDIARRDRRPYLV